MSASTLCRICVSEVNEFVYLLDLYYGDVAASLFIEDILKIDISNNHQGNHSSLIICETCNNTLKHFQLFYQTVKETQRKYKNIVGNSQESEPVDVEVMKQLPEDSVSYIINTDGYEVSLIELPNRPKVFTTSVLIKRHSKSSKNLQNANLSERIRSKIETSKCSVNSLNDFGLSDERIRIQIATETMLNKYNLKDIFRNGEIVLTAEDRLKMVELFFDLRCNDCEVVSFKTYKELVVHCLRCSGLQPKLICCKFHTRSLSLMEKHLINRHILKRKGANREKVICEICSKMVSRAGLNIHLSTHIPREKRKFKCSHCTAAFSFSSSLRSHTRSIHSVCKVKCSHCNVICKNNFYLKQHVTFQHSKDNTGVLCPKCGKICKTKYAFNQHLKTHSQGTERVQCPICEAVIKKSSLSVHLRRHDSNRNATGLKEDFTAELQQKVDVPAYNSIAMDS